MKKLFIVIIIAAIAATVYLASPASRAKAAAGVKVAAKGTAALVADGAPKAGRVTVTVAKKTGTAVAEAMSSASAN